MTFINPYLLWGSLAVAIPIIIHFWHQKRGAVIEWAAMQWLVEKDQQQQRGLKFDDLLLLIVRSLLVILLVLLVSRPIVTWLSKPDVRKPVHLVQPDARVVNNYRFELEEALKKGEPVYWATTRIEPVTALTVPRQANEPTALGLQNAINTLPDKKAPLHLYVLNSQQLAELPFIYVPVDFRLHTIGDSARETRRFLAVNQSKLFVNGSGRLASGTLLPQAIRYNPAPVHEGALAVLITLRNKTERQVVGAALNALTDVYKLDLAVSDQPVSGKQYDLVLTDRLPASPSPKTMYVVSGATPASEAANIMSVDGSFSTQLSDMVAGGQLPEWLGEQLVVHFGLNPAHFPLSQQQLNALFVPMTQTGTKPSETSASAAVHGGLLLAFMLLVGVERWLALVKK